MRRVVVVAVGLLLLAGCGVPTGGTPTTIPPSDVPYGLADASPTPSTTPAPEVLPGTARVYFLGAGDVLAPRGRELEATTRRSQLAELLDELAAGPTPGEKDEQLSTALPPQVRLTIADLEDGTATIRIQTPAQAPSGVAGRRAVAQIVMTATSVPGVRDVLLELDGEPVEAPLPGGELTTEPLTAEDFADFGTPSAVPVEPGPPEATPAPPS